MKTFFLFLLLFESFLEICGNERLASIEVSPGEPNLVAIGINQVISEYYVKRDERFDIFIAGNNTNELRDLVDDIVKVKPLNFPFQVHTIAEIDENILETKINRSAVVLCETYLACSDLFSSNYPVNMPYNGHYLIYMEEIDLNDKASLGRHVLIGLSPQFTYLLEESNNKIKLISYERFHQPNCRDWKEIEVNEMTKKKKTWETNEFFPNRFKNFNGCKLNVTAPYYRNPPYIILKKNNKSKTGWDAVGGFLIKVNEAIADSLNFKSEYLETKFSNYCDVELSILAPRKARWTILTHPVSTKRDIFLVPPGELYTPFDKLFLPFDYDTWFWMIITFSSGVVTILVLKFVPKEIRDFVCGPNVQSPLMNMAIGWFGGSQMALPRRNFARYLLILFLLFSLIMRTAYQGVQFDLMRKELRKPIVKTVNDLIDQGFKLYIPEIELALLKNTEIYESFKARHQDLPKTKTKSISISYLNELLPVGSKKAHLLYDVQLNNRLKDRNDNEELQPKILEEIFGTDLICLQFKKFNFMYEPYNDKIARLFEAGIVGKFVRDETEVHLKLEDDGPKVLTFYDLSTSFQVWLFFVAIAVISFVLEWIFNILGQILRTVIVQTTKCFSMPLNG